MKPVSLLLFFFLLGSCQNQQLQKLDEAAMMELILNNDFPDPETVVIKRNGQRISMDSLKALERTGQFFEDFYVNSSGEVVEIVIREITPEDQAFITKLSVKMNKPPELKTVEIDCADQANILQMTFERDQAMRTGGNQIDPQVDLENLEIVVSLLEQCGMPTLQEVNEVQMAGVWGVLQHAHPFYQRKYIPLLEKSAERGDIKMSVIATMKDRALMHEGEPQLYGSQMVNGQLYNLFEPEYVDQRRAEMGMAPLKEYLARFGVSFEVEQKEK